MRLLLVNPNITEAVTEVIAEEARRSASPGTAVDAITAPFGTAYVENRPEAAIAAHAVLEVLAGKTGQFDAAVVAAFGDPGLAAAKELLDVPVLGLAECAFHAAAMAGGRYSVICMTERLANWYRECACEHHMDARLASVRAIEAPDIDLARARDTLAEPFLHAARAALEEDRAECIIIGGGPVAGLARDIAPALPVPVIDGVSAAVRFAEAMHGLGLSPARHGSFARPEPKASRGLSAALAGHLDSSR